MRQVNSEIGKKVLTDGLDLCLQMHNFTLDPKYFEVCKFYEDFKQIL